MNIKRTTKKKVMPIEIIVIIAAITFFTYQTAYALGKFHGNVENAKIKTK